jgi:hypothetical protein
MQEIRNLATTTPAQAASPIKPPQFPAYKKGAPLDVFTAKVATFKQHEYFKHCTWDAKAPGKDKESIYLCSELLCTLRLELQCLFTNGSCYDNDGFPCLIASWPTSSQNPTKVNSSPCLNLPTSPRMTTKTKPVLSQGKGH